MRPRGASGGARLWYTGCRGYTSAVHAHQRGPTWLHHGHGQTKNGPPGYIEELWQMCQMARSGILAISGKSRKIINFWPLDVWRPLYQWGFCQKITKNRHFDPFSDQKYPHLGCTVPPFGPPLLVQKMGKTRFVGFPDPGVQKLVAWSIILTPFFQFSGTVSPSGGHF